MVLTPSHANGDEGIWSPQTLTLRTAEKGDVQRWYTSAEKSLEEKYGIESHEQRASLDGGDGVAIIGARRIQVLTQMLSSRATRDVEEVLQTLLLRLQRKNVRNFTSDTESVDTPLSPTNSSMPLTRSVSLRKAFGKMLPSLWQSPLPRVPATSKSLVVLLCRARVVLSDVVIGVLLSIRERIYAHGIFWKWVDLHPMLLMNSHEANRRVKIMQTIEKALDVAAGLVHSCAAEITLLDLSQNVGILDVVGKVGEVNANLLRSILENCSVLLNSEAPCPHDTTVIDKSILTECHALLNNLRTPQEQRIQTDYDVIQGMLDELYLANNFADNILSQTKPLYYWYYSVQCMKLGGIALITVTLCGYLHYIGKWAQIANWGKSTAASWWEFFATHVVDPLKDIYHELSTPLGRVHDVSMTSIKESRGVLQHMLIDFIKTTSPNDKTALEAAEKNGFDDPAAWKPVNNVLEEQIKYPLFNAARGEVGRALILEVIKTKVAIDEQAVEVAAILRTHRMNMNIMATVPAVGLVWWVTSVLGRLQNKLSRRLPIDDPAIKCFFSLRDIHKLFTSMQHSGLPEDISTEYDFQRFIIWLQEHGRVLSALSMLERSVASMKLRIEEKTALADDLENLKAMYAAKQVSVAEVDRIWKSYPCFNRAYSS
eukprot:TRINITY_DN9031_c0_g1_i2.p1 TRINITY_DN9031_c0_g1~~TRINITY_DN9031_c0_g1_i2.p1  ORF type:complete len:656 (+),score=110.36 TRINITY_DN9031_c0_g1_i2:50-2017(+)